MKIIEKEFNALTGQETIIEREETQEEQSIRLQYEAQFEAEKIEAASRAEARQVILDRLGITAEEAAILLG
jgi:hypothetical protein